MSKTFSKELCLSRLQSDGVQPDKESEELINKLDGLEIPRDTIKIFEHGQFWYPVDAVDFGVSGVKIKDCVGRS